MKRLICVFMTAALLLSALTACSLGGGKEEKPLRLWFASGEGERTLSLETEIYTGEENVPSLLSALLTGPAIDRELRALIPEGTQILAWHMDGDLALVDLSGEYGRLSGLDLTLADYSIVLTLTQLEQVRRVRITVEGKDHRYRSKQVLSRDDVVLSGAEEEPVELTAALCFRRIGGNELGEELRVFRLTENQSAPLSVLQALLAGPQQAGLEALLPGDLEVYSARMEAGVCYADFSAALLRGLPGTEEEQQLVIRSIVDSLCSLGVVQAVQILVEGEPLTWYGQVDVSKPLN